MNGVPEVIRDRMRAVLTRVCEQIVPGSAALVKPHVWRNPTYVGLHAGKPASWCGWSANLRTVSPHFKTIYFDYIGNPYVGDNSPAIFGEVFAAILRSLQSFSFMCVTSCGYEHKAAVMDAGYTFRQINHTIHPGIVLSEKELLELQPAEVAKMGFDLLQLQLNLSKSLCKTVVSS